MIPDTITKEHVLQAIDDIDKNGLRYPLGKSSVYDLIYKGKAYPPKHTIAVANEYANGSMLSHTEFNTIEAQKLLTQLSDAFIIQIRANDPLPSLITRYKKYLDETKLQEELYKWQLLKEFGGRPNLNNENFTEEIRSINFSNLIYGIGIGVTNHIARDAPEEYKACFRNLFDEEIQLSDRIKNFSINTLAIYRSLGVEKVSHHQDERTIATFLTYHNPDKYAFYKDSFYQKYCKLLGIKPQSINEKYPHYLELLKEFISDYIVPDNELLNTVNEFLPENTFKDSNHLLLAQDILYQTLDKQYGAGRNYWRIGTKDSEISYWDSMLSNNKIAIGWSDLGDLNNLNLTSKKEIETALNKKKYYPKDKNTLSRKAGEIFNFYNNLKIGDIILAQDGAKILGIGLVKDEYNFEPDEGFAHQKDVEWLAQNPDFGNKQGLQTTVYKINDPSVINKVDKIINGSMITNDKINSTAYHPLNRILFGPPGTGKTYNTINKALEIIGEEAELSLDMSDRVAVKAQFQQRMDEGRIVFTTFHQSMTYEDFIEGIKPITTTENEVIYETKDGLFKEICTEALKKKIKANNFEIVYKQLLQEIDNAPNSRIIIETLVHSKEFTIYKNSKDNIKFHANTEKAYEGVIKKDILEHYLKTGEALDWSSYVKAIGNYLKEKYNYTQSEEIIDKNFVLIIDEINRGNVSQIFGELITLIEEDKRIGKEEALMATLPYSKKEFGVPHNLYIIGTMNTADRSVEALDTALRRRFNFEEMAPKSSLIKSDGKLKAQGGIINGIDLVAVLDKINTRIELLLDKDHLIGHSFFMQVDSIDKLKEAFQNKIIPLLQEYFYGDFGKIGLVLGAGFIKEKNLENVNKVFSQSFKYDTSSLDDKPVYELIDYTQPVDYTVEFNKQILIMNFEKAIELLLS
jgi:hypothetical protein